MDKTGHVQSGCYGDAIVPWVPVLGLGASDTRVGLVTDATDHIWVFQAGDGKLHSIDTQPMAALPILERPFHEARAFIRRSLLEHGFDDDREGTFPYKATLGCALSFTDYWVDKALNWLDEQAELLEELQLQLRAVRTSQSQRNRHRAAALLRRTSGGKKT